MYRLNKNRTHPKCDTRSLTGDQISIVNEASQVGYKKPKQYLKAFRARAKDLLATGFFLHTNILYTFNNNLLKYLTVHRPYIGSSEDTSSEAD